MNPFVSLFHVFTIGGVIKSAPLWQGQRLRQYFPKSTNLLSVSDCDVDEAVYQLNHRPKKHLGYLTPQEVFYGLDISPITLPTDALCT